MSRQAYGIWKSNPALSSSICVNCGAELVHFEVCEPEAAPNAPGEKVKEK
jgi:hypothetical protein